VVHLRKLHEQYGDRVQILFVYTRGAGHAPPEGLEDLVEDENKPPGQRPILRRLARAGMKHFHLNFPCLLDDAEDSVATLYRAFPKRLLLLDGDGKIVLDSGREPDAAFPWEVIHKWIEHPMPASTEPEA
jgi:hypothetical protein